MGEKVIAFFSGAAKAYDIFGSLGSDDKKFIKIESGFQNVGEAFKKVICEDVKQDTKNQTKQVANGQ